MIYRSVEQGSYEWWVLKSLKLSASNATAIANCGKGLETLVNKLVNTTPEEAYNQSQRFISEDIERGRSFEAEAREQYSILTGSKVQEVGFISDDDNKHLGMSPDGLVGLDGGIEIKCRNIEKHLKLVETRKISSGTMWQIQMSLLISKRQWWDFVGYNPLCEQPLVIIRVLPEEEKQEKLFKGIEIGTKMIINKLNTKV